MKQEDATLYALHTEMVNKRKKLAEIKEEIETLKINNNYNILKQKLETLMSSLNIMVESQEKINSKKAATIMKLQRDSSSTFEKENILLLPQKYHKDMKNIVGNQEKIENLLCAVQVKDNFESSEKAIMESQNLSTTWNKQLSEDIHLFKSSEGLYKNVLLMKNLNLDKSTLDETETESDLGCYPHDTNSVNASNSFATSSPIYKINKSRVSMNSATENQPDL